MNLMEKYKAKLDQITGASHCSENKTWGINDSEKTEMQASIKDLIQLDLKTDSSLYIDERIAGSAAVCEAYRTGDKKLFIENAVSLIALYTKCKKAYKLLL